MPTSRRHVLAAAGLAAIAGCSSVLGGNDGQRPFRERQIVEVSETVRIESGDYWAREFTFDVQSVLLYSVVASDNVDVLLLPRESFERYRDDLENHETADRLRIIGELSERNTSATAQGSAVTPGDPVLVVDNSGWETPPVEEVRAEVDVEAFVRPERFRGQSTPERSGSENGSSGSN